MSWSESFGVAEVMEEKWDAETKLIWGARSNLWLHAKPERRESSLEPIKCWFLKNYELKLNLFDFSVKENTLDVIAWIRLLDCLGLMPAF